MKKFILILIISVFTLSLSAQQNSGSGWQFKRIEWKKSHKAKKGTKVRTKKGSYKKAYAKNQRIRRQRSCWAYR